MQHVVFGAGLIGGYLGGVLAHRSQSVSLVVRDSARERWQQGLRLSDYQGHQAGPLYPRLLGSNWRADVKPCDVLWLTVKCTQLAQAAMDAQPLIGPQTKIFCCQNGVGSESLVKAIYPHNQIRRVIVSFNVVESAPGCLHRGSEGQLTLECLSEKDEIGELVTLLDCALMPTGSAEDMLALQWAKLQLNLGNAVNALADIPVKSMLEEQGYRLILAALMDELLSVCKARQLRLPKLTKVPARWLPFVLSLPNWLFLRVASAMLEIDPGVRTSMWWDLKQGKDSEIAYLNGAVIEQALSLGLDCKVNQVIVTLVHQVEQGKLKIGMSAQQLQECIGLKGGHSH